MPGADMLTAGTETTITPLLLDTLTGQLEQAAERAIEFIPELILGAIILAVGYVVATRLEPVVARAVDRMRVDQQLDGSHISDALGYNERPASDDQPPAGEGDGPGHPPQGPGPRGPRVGPVARATGVVVKYYVILFAVFLAAENMGLDRLGEWMERLIAYAPEFLAGVAVIIVGLVFADYAATRTRNAEFAAEHEYGGIVAALVRATLYVVVLVVGLEMIGFDLQVVYIVLDGVASAIGVGITVAIALAAGVAAALFAKDYYEERSTES